MSRYCHPFLRAQFGTYDFRVADEFSADLRSSYPILMMKTRRRAV
jgi:hypothetical protein